jgi:N utilization substance protein B
VAAARAPGARPPREGARRLSRKLALDLLFQHDSQAGPPGGPDPRETVRLFEECFAPGSDEEGSLGIGQEAFEASWPLAVELFLGIAGLQAELDRDIAEALLNWRLDRVSKVDRAIIRLAYFEMRHRPDIPQKTSLNEAVEMAKAYGEAESGAFVNGVLDKLRGLLPPEGGAPPQPGP